MNQKGLLELSQEDKSGIVGLVIVAEMFGGVLGMALNRKYYPLHLFRKSNYKTRRIKNYRRLKNENN